MLKFVKILILINIFAPCLRSNININLIPNKNKPTKNEKINLFTSHG